MRMLISPIDLKKKSHFIPVTHYNTTNISKAFHFYDPLIQRHGPTDATPMKMSPRVQWGQHATKCPLLECSALGSTLPKLAPLDALSKLSEGL